MDRRNALKRITAVVGGIAVAVASVPFIRYFVPSEKAKALGSPIAIDLSTFQPGEIRSFVWRGMPVLVLRRDQTQLASLEITSDHVIDATDHSEGQPEYVDPIHRGRNSEFLVLLGNCTHLGCIPGQNLKRGRSLIGEWWPGGFVCPCHWSMFDYAGRVVRGPAPTNLRVPPHWFESPTRLIVGEDEASV